MESRILPFRAVHPTVVSLYGRHGRPSALIYITVLLSIFGGLALLPFVQIDVSSQAPGMIRTEQVNNAIAAGISGQLRAVRVAENAAVRRGDTLLMLRTDHLDEQLRYQQEQQRERARYLRDLTLLLGSTAAEDLPPLQTDLYRQEWLQYRQQLSELEVKSAYADNQFARQEQLFHSGSIARMAFEATTFERTIARQAVDRHRQQQRQQWESARLRYRDEQREAESTVRQLRQQARQHVVTAPIDGVITQVGGWQVGNFIAAGQPVAQIAPAGHLRVEAYVSPADIGQVRTGMPVRFQVDAFNHHQWGLVRGWVTEIAPDIVARDAGPVFVVHCELEQEALQLPSGYTGRLKNGMTLRAHFQLARRSLFQLLYDRAEDWIDPRNESL